MNPNIIPLEEIRIAKPCRADWQNMTGDERARFCGSCHKNVYDISQMTRAEAHQLIAQREGDVCVRLYRRPDGTVITSDCPVGKRELRKPMWWTLAGFVALMASGAAVRSQPVAVTAHTAPNAAPNPAPNPAFLVNKARQWPVIGALVGAVSPRPRIMVMGRMAAPTLAPTPVPAPLPIEPEMGEVAFVPDAPAPTCEPKK